MCRHYIEILHSYTNNSLREDSIHLYSKRYTGIDEWEPRTEWIGTHEEYLAYRAGIHKAAQLLDGWLKLKGE